MLHHLDDPVPLQPATAAERRATAGRGEALRRRRRALAVAVPTAVAVAGALVVGLTALSPGRTSGRTDAPAVAPAASSTTGSVVFAGAEEVGATVTLPPGWETREVFVLKSDSDPLLGLSFYDAADLYADGCQWVLLQPRVGPTVDDLVAGFARLPGFGGDVQDVAVDGFRGKLVEYTVPDYDPDECQDGRFGLFREDQPEDGSVAPNLWAQAPHQRNEFRILDVRGTRLVVGLGYPPDISAKDLRQLRTVLDSVEIG